MKYINTDDTLRKVSTHKNGIPTAYGFACGYIQVKEKGKARKELYKEHGVYHVKQWKTYPSKPVIWVSTEFLTTARKAFKKIKL